MEIPTRDTATKGGLVIQQFVDRFRKKKDILRERLTAKPPESYKDLVQHVVSIIADENEPPSIDPNRVHLIDDGDYQGTLLFVIAANNYQPSCYWYVKVGYGSCSGCDTFLGIRSYEHDPLNTNQVDDYMTLALHIVQGLTSMNGEGT